LVVENETGSIIQVDQLPNDPFAMPPPYWRSSGAAFHIVDALEEIIHLFEELVPVHEETEMQIHEFFERHPHENLTEDENEEFANICDELEEIEIRIKLRAEIAVLMSAIQMEDDLNRFCVYNLHKNIAESIEKLSSPEKLLIATTMVAQQDVKGDRVYDAVRKLSSWRNAFAHGHCTDRPTKSLRHNHLINPEEYPGVPSVIAEVKELVGGYIQVTDHLRSISKNPYMAGRSSEVEQMREHIKEIGYYRFVGNNTVYNIEIEGL